MNNPVPVPPTPVVAPAIPWYKSPQEIGLITTAVSALIALFPKVGQLLGLTSASDIATAVTNVFGVIALIAPVIGSIVRVNSKAQPLTLTQAGAEAHPNTQATVITQARMAAANIPTNAVVAAQLTGAAAAPVQGAPTTPVQIHLTADEIDAIASAVAAKQPSADVIAATTLVKLAAAQHQARERAAQWAPAPPPPLPPTEKPPV
jgi:hypothetical protein